MSNFGRKGVLVCSNLKLKFSMRSYNSKSEGQDIGMLKSRDKFSMKSSNLGWWGLKVQSILPSKLTQMFLPCVIDFSPHLQLIQFSNEITWQKWPQWPSCLFCLWKATRLNICRKESEKQIRPQDSPPAWPRTAPPPRLRVYFWVLLLVAKKSPKTTGFFFKIKTAIFFQRGGGGWGRPEQADKVKT